MHKVPWMYIVILSIIELTALFIGTKSWKWEMFCLVSSSVKQLSDSEVKTTSTCVLLIFEPSIWNDLDFTSYKKWTIFKKNTVLETLNQIWYISYVRIKKKINKNTRRYKKYVYNIVLCLILNFRFFSNSYASSKL